MEDEARKKAKADSKKATPKIQPATERETNGKEGNMIKGTKKDQNRWGGGIIQKEGDWCVSCWLR